MTAKAKRLINSSIYRDEVVKERRIPLNVTTSVKSDIYLDIKFQNFEPLVQKLHIIFQS